MRQFLNNCKEKTVDSFYEKKIKTEEIDTCRKELETIEIKKAKQLSLAFTIDI